MRKRMRMRKRVAERDKIRRWRKRRQRVNAWPTSVFESNYPYSANLNPNSMLMKQILAFAGGCQLMEWEVGAFDGTHSETCCGKEITGAAGIRTYFCNFLAATRTRDETRLVNDKPSTILVQRWLRAQLLTSYLPHALFVPCLWRATGVNPLIQAPWKWDRNSSNQTLWPSKLAVLTGQ